MAKLLLWTPAPWAKTGYGKNALNLALRSKEAGHEVAIFAFGGCQWGEVEYRGIRVFPNNAADYGQTYLPIWASYYKPDIIIQHFDLWVCGDLLSKLKDKLPPVYVYSPCDHDPLPPPLVRAVQGATKVIAMTRFAEAKFSEAGIQSVYIPHSVDTKTYYPQDRKEARKRLGLPEDGCLFLSVATNKGPRKNLGNLLRAFKNFLDQVPEARKDAYLYIHAFIYGGPRNQHGYNLPEIWKNLGIADRIKCTEPNFYEAIGFTEEELADLYRSADWTVLCSLGEGFGIPVIESMACGVPVIFSNFFALPEVVGPSGLPVDAAESIPFELSSSFQFIPSTSQITQRMVEAYLDWKDGGKLRDQLGERGRQHVLKNYDWDVVLPKWLELIEETKPRETKKATIGWINENTSSERVGGAELTSKELIKYGRELGYKITEVTPANFNLSFDLLVVNNIRTFPGLFIEKILEKDFVFLCHDTRIFLPSSSEVWLPIYEILLQRAKKIIFLSPRHKKCYEEKFNLDSDKVSFFPPPLDPDIYYEDEKEEICVSTSLIAKHKGIENVIKLAKEKPDLEFRLYGRLEYSLPKLPNLRYMGIVEPSRIPTILAKAKYFVQLPECIEPFGSGLVKAYLSGCELITNENLGCFSYDWWGDKEKVKEKLREAPRKFWEEVENVLSEWQTPS